MGVVHESPRELSLEAFLEPAGRDAPLMCVRVPARPACLRTARTLAEVTLRVYGVLPHILDAAPLIVSELVTNVILYNKWDLEPVVVLIMRQIGPTLRIEVLDSEPSIPKLQAAADESESGRGLQIVQAISDKWGVELMPPIGKFVWCELAAWPDKTDQL